ncbi:MAG TPA: radical SAM protein [Polyangiaceae bacterium]|nr:radical SAM protein [Polyangiaceae bacterium]
MLDCAPCATRTPTTHVYYSMTKGLCSTCKRGLDVKIHFRDQQVWFDKFCPEHGHHSCLVSSSVEWYLDALSFVAPNTPPKNAKNVKQGCPFDCGPCKSHQQKTYMPVVPITSACNLDCPICYTVNKNDDPHLLSEAAFQQTLDQLKDQHDELDIINFTGGEPTLHPGLPQFLKMARAAGIQRLTVSTNGLKLLNEDYVKELAEADARIVLSLDTFDEQVDQQMLGAKTVKSKLKVLEHLARHDVTTTLLPAVAAGLNDKDVGPLFELMLSKPNICSLELHTLTFTGQGGTGFNRAARITTPDLHRILNEATGDKLRWTDFVPSPLAHPHCYSICYLLLLDDGGYVPFTRFLGRARLFELLGDSIYIQPRERIEQMLRDAIDELWAAPESLPESEAVLKTLKRLVREMFPESGALSLAERQKIAERASKAIYIHSHMDEESFDVSRIMKCSVGVPETDGSNIPTCAYNVLYREKDARFAGPDAQTLLHATRPAPSRQLPLVR